MGISGQSTAGFISKYKKTMSLLLALPEQDCSGFSAKCLTLDLKSFYLICKFGSLPIPAIDKG